MTDWAEPFTASYRFMRVDHSTMMETERLTSLEQSGSISRNQDTALKESGRLTAHGPFDIGADFLRVYLDAEGMYTGWRESVVLGTFLASTSSREVDGPNSTSSVSLTGLLKIADDDDFDAPVTLQAGEDVVSFCASVLEDIGLRVERDESDFTLSVPWVFGAESGEEGKLDAVNELLDMAGFSSARTDPMGTVQLRRYVDPSGRSPSHAFAEGRNARFLTTMTDELDTSEVRNVVKAIYSTQNGTVIGVAEDDDPASPWSTASLGRRIVGVYRYSDDADQVAADAKAAELLAGSRSVIRRVTLEHVIVPGVSIGDVFSADYPTGSVSGDFAVRTQDIDLGAGCMVTTEGKRSERL